MTNTIIIVSVPCGIDWLKKVSVAMNKGGELYEG